MGGALVLVPAVLAAWRGTSSQDHAQEVFEAVQDLLDTPTNEELAQSREAGVNDRATAEVQR